MSSLPSLRPEVQNQGVGRAVLPLRLWGGSLLPLPSPGGPGSADLDDHAGLGLRLLRVCARCLSSGHWLLGGALTRVLTPILTGTKQHSA